MDKIFHKFFSAAAVMLAAVACLLTSCSSDSQDVARQLLSTVPSSAGVVAVIDTESIIDDAGGAEFLKKLVRERSGKAKADEMFKVWDPAPVVVFYDGGYLYMTTHLTNASAVMAQMERTDKVEFTDQDGVKCNDKFAVVGDQLWMLLSGGTLNPTNIKSYSKLSQNRSFASSAYCDDLLKEGEIAYICDIHAMYEMSAGVSNSQYGSLAMQMLFNDASYIAGGINFNKGKAEMTSKVLTSKYKMAEFQLPTGKVDTSVIKMLSSNTQHIVAINIPKSLVRKVCDIGKTFGGIPGEVEAAISPIDGTIVLSFDSKLRNAEGIISVNGSASALSKALSNQNLTVAEDGKYLRINEGDATNGTLIPSEMASAFKGAVAGYVGEAPFLPGATMTAMYYVEHGGLLMKMTVKTPGSDNFLNYVLKQMQ
ncbi:MAG TPA: hypothetical protein DC009_01310 [Porphyromonadaceae bacterium]|nr:hypothetical protein [Porphyromonadaceae bacterium]